MVHAFSVRDPQVDVHPQIEWPVLKGNSSVLYSMTPANGAPTAQQVQFNLPMPSDETFLSKNMDIELNITLPFTGTATNSQGVALPGGFLIPTAPVNGVVTGQGQPVGTDGLRQLPFNSCCNSSSLNANNNTITWNPSQIVQAIIRYQKGCYDKDEFNAWLSTTPIQPDLTPAFSQTYLSNISPFVPYNVNPLGRGAFPVVITQTANTGAASATFTIRERILMPGLHGGAGYEDALVRLKNTVILLFQYNFSTCWKHDAVNGAQNFVVGTPVVNTARLYYQFINVYQQAGQSIPEYCEYVYDKFEVAQVSNFALAAGATESVPGQLTQLSSNPKMMYFFGNPAVPSVNTPDVFFTVTNVSLKINSQDSILRNASEHQLYQMSLQNSHSPEFSFPSWQSQAGSVVGLKPGLNFIYPDGTIPGMAQQSNVTPTITLRNNSAVSYGIGAVSMWSVYQYEGKMTIGGGMMSLTDAMGTYEQGAAAQPQSGRNYYNSIHKHGVLGRGWFTRGWSWFKKAIPAIAKGVIKYGPKVIQAAQAALPFIGGGKRHHGGRYSNVGGRGADANAMNEDAPEFLQQQ